MKKMVLKVILTMSVWTVSLCGVYSTCQAESEVSISVVNVSQEIQPRKEILEWRYKVVNGRLYKRLYNATRHEWAGNWIRIK